jgi:hypothetical protein
MGALLSRLTPPGRLCRRGSTHQKPSDLMLCVFCSMSQTCHSSVSRTMQFCSLFSSLNCVHCVSSPPLARWSPSPGSFMFHTGSSCMAAAHMQGGDGVLRVHGAVFEERSRTLVAYPRVEPRVCAGAAR